jgi:hypothetical protein
MDKTKEGKIGVIYEVKERRVPIEKVWVEQGRKETARRKICKRSL